MNQPDIDTIMKQQILDMWDKGERSDCKLQLTETEDGKIITHEERMREMICEHDFKLIIGTFKRVCVKCSIDERELNA